MIYWHWMRLISCCTPCTASQTQIWSATAPSVSRPQQAIRWLICESSPATRCLCYSAQHSTADGSRLFASDFTHNRVVSWNTTEFQHLVSRMKDAGGASDIHHHIPHRSSKRDLPSKRRQ